MDMKKSIIFPLLPDSESVNFYKRLETGRLYMA